MSPETGATHTASCVIAPCLTSVDVSVASSAEETRMSVERSTPDCSTPLPPVVMELIQIKAKQLARTYCFPVDDHDDIAQEITIDILRRRHRFEPGWERKKAFQETVVGRAAARVVERRSATTRDYRRETRLQDRQVLDEDKQWIALIDILHDPGRENSGAMIDLRIDLKDVISRLPRRLATICRHFLEAENPTDVAKHVSRHRSSIYNARRDIRKRFIEAALKNYLENHLDTFCKTPVLSMGRTSPRLPKGKRA